MSAHTRRSIASAALSFWLSRPWPSSRWGQLFRVCRLPMRSFDPLPAPLIELPVLGGEEVEQQAIARATVDVMALPLPADEAEAEAFDCPERRVMLRSPGIDHMK